MPLVQQFADRISLHSDRGHYVATQEDFRRHYGRDLPPLPEGIDQRGYEPGVRHALAANNSVLDGGPMPWPEGDAVLAQIDELIKKQLDDAEAELAAKKQKVEDEIEAQRKAFADKAAEQQAEMTKQIERVQAEQTEFDRQNKERVAAFVAKRNVALDKLAAVLQRAGASGAETQEIIDGIWPKPPAA